MFQLWQRPGVDMQDAMRERLSSALKQAMKTRDQRRLSTLRLINAAIKDRDIAARSESQKDGVSDDDILAILGRMVKQRHDSVRAYEEGGRLDLAEQERGEIEVIEEFLPRPLTDAEEDAAIAEVIDEIGAGSVRDMGRVMSALKAKYPGRLDFAATGAKVKTQLCG